AGHSRDLPGLTAVAGRGDQPSCSRRRVAIAKKYSLGPSSDLRQASTVRVRQPAPDPERTPGVAVVIADVGVVVGGGQQTTRSSPRGRHHGEAVNILRAESGPNLLPRLPAIATPPRAVDLDAGPDRLRIGRVCRQTGDARVHDARALALHIGGRLRPGP